MGEGDPREGNRHQAGRLTRNYWFLIRHSPVTGSRRSVGSSSRRITSTLAVLARSISSLIRRTSLTAQCTTAAAPAAPSAILTRVGTTNGGIEELLSSQPVARPERA